MKLFISVMLCFAALSMPAYSLASKKPVSWGDTNFVEYPTTHAVFYGSDIDLDKEWNICTGSTDGGVEVHMTQQILPIQNCPGEYVVVRTYTDKDGKLIKRTILRLSSYGSVPI
ncbi:MAG: hypothetical protein K2L49_04250 [Muribaculaceae bacterium]|nr:hypothetical protein [Muribaculaceae bacterium]